MALLALVLVCASAPASAQGLQAYEAELIGLVARVRPSVVQVTARAGEHELSWSGVVYDASGHVVTAGQALAELTQLRVTLHDGSELPAKLVGWDPLTRLGVLKVEASKGALTPVPRGDADAVRVGAFTVVIGNPFGLSGSVSTGIISGKGRTIRTGTVVLQDMLQTTASINPGDSGGLLADSRGRMIGIITSTFGRAPSSDSVSQAMRRMLTDPNVQRQLAVIAEIMRKGQELKDPEELMAFMARKMRELEKLGGGARRPSGPSIGMSAQGINFVLPADQVHQVTRDLIAHGRVMRSWLGVKVRLERLDEPSPTVSLVVDEVVADGPSARAGLKVGDVLVSVGGRPLPDLLTLRQLILATRPGDVVAVVARRGEKTLTLTLTMGRAPAPRK